MTAKILALDIEKCIEHDQVGNGQGYGTTYLLTEEGRVRRLAHRAIFEAFHGYRPPVVMHECDNPRCININHLAPGDWDKNNKDRASKGRSAKNRPDRRHLTADQVREIRARFSPNPGGNRPNPDGVSALAREFAVDTNVIYQIVQGRTYREVV